MTLNTHTLANRIYAFHADDVYDQNFADIKSTAVDAPHFF
jgi:hypothetical protein